ncbi:MAG: sigma-54 dependent transcriptional regulator [Thermodesulfovibrionia bacterium]
MNLKALIDADIAKEIRKLLLEEDFEIYDLPEKELLLEEVARGVFHVIFLNCYDCSSCSDTIGQTIKNIKELDPRIEIIGIGTRKDNAEAIEAIKSGVTACFGKPVELNRLRETIGRIKEIANIRKETYQIETALHEKYVFAGMVSKNPIMLDIFQLIRRIAPYYSTILIVGGTGTGKEVLAKAIHSLSSVSREPFIACNCSGFVDALIESELFGHVKGAYTGAVSDKKGLFEAAGSGTIFLDEIGDMPLSFQPHFLRVLHDGEFRRVGSIQPMKAKCRVIAATNVNLHKQMKIGRFREDLYFRLAVITIKLPLLMEKKEDIPLLCRFFLNRLKEKTGKKVFGITRPAQSLLMSYDWPGNIRELENVIERAVLVTTANFIRPEDLPVYIKELRTETTANLSLNNSEKNFIQQVLITTGGNKTKAATILGISRRALFRKINKHGLTENKGLTFKKSKKISS